MTRDPFAGQIDTSAAPSGPGCAECTVERFWWLHLRRCAACGHIGCCDDSLRRHATAHAAATGHRFIQSFEPGEEWFWDYTTEGYLEPGPQLAPPTSHPANQPVPGPGGRVPADWTEQLEERNAREEAS